MRARNNLKPTLAAVAVRLDVMCSTGGGVVVVGRLLYSHWSHPQLKPPPNLTQILKDATVFFSMILYRLVADRPTDWTKCGDPPSWVWVYPHQPTLKTVWRYEDAPYTLLLRLERLILGSSSDQKMLTMQPQPPTSHGNAYRGTLL